MVLHLLFLLLFKHDFYSDVAIYVLLPFLGGYTGTRIEGFSSFDYGRRTGDCRYGTALDYDEAFGDPPYENDVATRQLAIDESLKGLTSGLGHD